MRTVLACLALLALASATVHFEERFGAGWEKRWVSSSWKKSSGEAGKFDVSAGEFYGDAEEGKGLRTTQDARFYAISSKFPKFSNEGKDLVIQFQVKFPQNIDCGGGYIKVGSSEINQDNFGGDHPYHIMFGPDICGHSTKKVHVIFHSAKKNENLLIKKEIRAESDRLSHVYTLIVHPDNTYEVQVDGEKRESGKLEEDWAFLAPKQIKDPSVSKPSDWVDEAQIDDPSDKKPTDWDNTPKVIPDPDAAKPSDWDDEADGEWEAPTIDNPEYKGEWRPKRIANPAYKGVWVHPEIDNPEYSAEPNLYRYTDIGSVGVDIWQVKAGTIFDNIIITDSIAEADALRAATYTKYKDAEKAALEALEKAQKEKDEEARKKAESEKATEDDDEEEEEEHDEL